MKKIILYFLIVLGSIWIGSKIYQHPGYIMVMYQHWLVESTVWFLALIILLFFLLFHFLLNLIKQTRFLPSRLNRWLNKRKLQKSIERMNKGYSELIIGRWKKAEKFFTKASQKKPLAFMNYLLAAHAAEGYSDYKKRDRYLLQAQALNEKNNFAVDVLRVQFLLNNGKPEEAITLLTRLCEKNPKEPYLLRLQTEAYLALGEYFHLQTILLQVKKSKIFPDETFAQIEKETYLHIFKDQYFSDFSEVQAIWNKMPSYLRHDPDVLIEYAKHLHRWNRSDEAEELIRKELKRHYSNEVMEYYVTIKSKYPAKQIALGTKWLKDKTNDPTKLTIMGMLCLRNRLWGQARDYLEASQKINPIAENYLVLGYIYEKLGDTEKALQYYRMGLKSQNAVPF